MLRQDPIFEKLSILGQRWRCCSEPEWAEEAQLPLERIVSMTLQHQRRVLPQNAFGCQRPSPASAVPAPSHSLEDQAWGQRRVAVQDVKAGFACFISYQQTFRSRLGPALPTPTSLS